MNHQQLTTFCTVLAEGSMTAAADKLFLTQPAVSQQIKNLEEELSVSLLDRGVRKVKATLQGQMLYDYAKKILQLTQQAEIAIQTISQELSGEIRIGTQNSIGLFLISPIVGLFLKHNSKLSIKIDYESPEELVRKMKANELDLAILPDAKSEYFENFDNYDERFLFKDEMWLVGSGKDTTLPKSITIREFAEKPIVYYSSMYPTFKEQLEKSFKENNIEFSPVFEADNVGTLKRVIETGLGWGFLPSHCIKKQVRSGRLLNIQVEGLKHFVNLNLYSVKNERTRKTADVFYRALLQQAIS